MQRRTLGIFLLVLFSLCTSLSYAQVTGDVESVGFSSLYRPDSWTPMVVRLQPQTAQTATYQIQVVQEDLDRDHPIYSRTVTVTGNTEGQPSNDQRFWMYFIPQPTEWQNAHGLPDASDGLPRLQERLKVFVTNAAGTKQISQLPITSTINKLDGYRSSFAEGRGTKMILVVSDQDSGSLAMSNDYSQPDLIQGIQENVAMIPVTPADLPDDPRGYDAVDAIILLHVDPANLKLPTDQRMRALRQYVSSGGRLVICQLPQWEKMAGYGDLLPVSFPQLGQAEPYVQGNVESNNLGPLRSLAKANDDPTWNSLKGPISLAVAEANTNTVVDQWIDWPQNASSPIPPKTPYIVRALYGVGSVTWVAQDLGDPNVVSRARSNWTNIWDRVFDWKEDPIILGNLTPKEIKDAYAPSTAVELGRGLLAGMEHGQRGATMVFVAIVFFIAYWVLAGPVAYFVLLRQDRARLSWFIFGASAFAATLVTVLVVKIALSGSPVIRHTTVARSGNSAPTVADARIGLYIPKDGPQTISLQQTAPDTLSYITPFPIHPQFASGNDYPAYLEYTVPIHDGADDPDPSIVIPFRRTLKKIQARWIGISKTGIEGSAELRPADQGYLSGTVTNATGNDLSNLYLAFKFPASDDLSQDWVLYVPHLAKGGTIDLSQEFKSASILPPDVASVEQLKGQSVRGIIGQPGRELQWDTYWFNLLHSATSGIGDNNFSDLSRSFPILSLFERIPPAKITTERKDRFEILRRGARKLDCSHLVAAGALVVLAESDNSTLPFPLEVNSNPTPGTGTTFYQAIIPLKRPAPEPASQPSN
ncbi:MAG TPA: hypothetical protein VFE58_03810 [Tepidisphaeraceae bacterium]|jgi:hypothetical protein|nr:hypothetical protein [Tepidisphaeraceae bacterium]